MNGWGDLDNIDEIVNKRAERDNQDMD